LEDYCTFQKIQKARKYLTIVYIFCRRGIASRLAGAYLQDIGIESKIYNVVGGLKSYKESIDPNIVTL